MDTKLAGTPFSDEATRNAMADPQINMHFTERFAYHVFVVGRQGNLVFFVTAQGGQDVLKDGKWGVVPLKKFRDYHAYIADKGKEKQKYWVDYCGETHDTAGWLEKMVEQGNKQEDFQL